MAKKKQITNIEPPTRLTPRQRRARKRVYFLLMSALAFFFFVISLGGWWLVTQGGSTDLRSQASVDFEYSLNVVPVSAKEPFQSFEVILAAQSDLALPTGFTATLELLPGTTARPATEVQLPFQHRLLAENDDWLVSTPLENAVQFLAVPLEPVLATVSGKTVKAYQVQLQARATNGSKALQKTQTIVVVTAKKMRYDSSWSQNILLKEPAILGSLLSVPGAELNLLQQGSAMKAEKALQGFPGADGAICPVLIKTCPQGSTHQMNAEFSCGVCLDSQTGRRVGPIAPSPLAIQKGGM